jgi:hypothetical protein
MHYRLPSLVLVALVAAAVVVPYPALGCCGERKDDSSCCQRSSQRTESSAKASCCDKSELAVCAHRTCPCCQEAPPQNTSPTRVADRLPTNYGLVAPIAILPVSETPVGFDSLAATANVASAIPHRILHCSWLI